jgi:hypothetical protein
MDKQKKDWEQFYDEARGFHRTVRGSLKRPEVFTAELIQNIAAMGIEKYFMSIFTHRGLLPRNHTMGDFVEEAKAFMELPEKLEAALLYFDSLQSICSIDNISIVKPLPEDISRFTEAIDEVALLADKELASSPLPASPFSG